MTDGVAYGQPLLRPPTRARIHIAPRKSVDWISACDSAFEDPDEDAEDDENYDEDFNMEEEDDSYEEQPVRRSSRRVVATKQGQENAADESMAMVLHEGDNDHDDNGSEDVDDDFSDSGSSEEESSSSEAEQEPSRERKRVHWGGEEHPTTLETSAESRAEAPPSNQVKMSSRNDINKAPAPPVSLKRSLPEDEISDKSRQPTVPPGQGNYATQSRNKRRKMSKRLAFLKGQGLLPADANKEDLLKLETRQTGPEHDDSSMQLETTQTETKPNDPDTQLERTQSGPVQHGIRYTKPPPGSMGDLILQNEKENPGDLALALGLAMALAPRPPPAEKEWETEEEGSDVSGGSDSDSEFGSSGSDSDSDSSSEEASDSGSAPSVVNSIRKPVTRGTSKATSQDKEIDDSEFQKRREALLKQIAGGGIDVTPSQDSHKPQEREEKETQQDSVPSQNGDGTLDSAARKKKLDVRASQRMLLGSLGHRAPRNATERAALVQKMESTNKKDVSEQAVAKKSDPVSSALAEKAKKDPKLKALMRKVVAKTASKRENEEWQKHINECRAELEAANKANGAGAGEDPDFWKAHIELDAVECCEEDVKLSTPPFPFYQRWDPSQRKGKKRKRKEYYEEQDESYFGNGEEGGDGLDYDDQGEAEEWNGINGADEAYEIEDDLPSVPEDISTLPMVKEEELVSGDIIVFKNLEVSASTGWAPAVSPLRTAKVINEKVEPGQTLVLQLAKRDQPERMYDDEGNRVYEKFEMETGEGDDAEQGVLELGFVELVEPRLLARDS